MQIVSLQLPNMRGNSCRNLVAVGATSASTFQLKTRLCIQIGVTMIAVPLLGYGRLLMTRLCKILLKLILVKQQKMKKIQNGRDNYHFAEIKFV